MSAVNEFIKTTVAITVLYIALIIVLAYGGYFVGMIVSLAAGGLFGLEGVVLAEIFAWIGVGMAHVLFIAFLKFSAEKSQQQSVEIREEDLAELFEDIFDKEDDR